MVGLALLLIFTRDSTQYSERDIQLDILYHFLSHQVWFINSDVFLLVGVKLSMLTKMIIRLSSKIHFILQEQIFLRNGGLHYNYDVRNFERFVELARVESSSLGVFSSLMDILWGVDPGLILKTFPNRKGTVMSIENIPTNNNIFA